MTIELLAAHKSFAGEQRRYSHWSSSCNCEMRFSAFLPSISTGARVPVLYWLSGLTCTDENFVHKAGAQQFAEHFGIAVVAPDTSPRGEGVADDPAGSYDLGLGAGFYVNATRQPWASHYRMYDYVVEELPALISQHLPVDTSRQSIFGHSMGGHGAMVVALRNPDRYHSVSAFAPISAPSRCPWGAKAFTAYLGDDQASWGEYDSSVLIPRAAKKIPLLIDQGSADDFLANQLLPEVLVEAARSIDYPLDYRLREGYDHSYFFIASFMEEHLRFHTRWLMA